MSALVDLPTLPDVFDPLGQDRAGPPARSIFRAPAPGPAENLLPAGQPGPARPRPYPAHVPMRAPSTGPVAAPSRCPRALLRAVCAVPPTSQIDRVHNSLKQRRRLQGGWDESTSGRKKNSPSQNSFA